MTSPRTAYPTPPGQQPPRMRPSDERALLAASGRTTRRIALGALALAVVALALVAWRTVVSGGASGAACQATAWDATPATDQLPEGWALKGATYEVNRKSLSLVGPEPADTTTSQAVVYVTVTCYPDGAADAVTRAAAASKDAGQTVTPRPDLGDQAFSALDGSGAAFVQLRHGNVVADLAASGDATPTEVDQLASAFDKALGGDGGTIASPDLSSAGPDASGDLSSPGASGDGTATESPAAPELEKALPTTVGTVTLTVGSAVGTTFLADHPRGRFITAALRAAGKTSDQLRAAQAYDETSAADLALVAISVDGMSVDKMRQFVLDAWLGGTGAGVTTTSVTMSGHVFSRIDYGDEGAIDYVTAETDKIIVITTADPSLAQQAAAALP
jgi:hypothetical protein